MLVCVTGTSITSPMRERASNSIAEMRMAVSLWTGLVVVASRLTSGTLSASTGGIVSFKTSWEKLLFFAALSIARLCSVKI